ncbi:hypothetical protein RclHR1_03220011 [Rhizophagus clarus]|uniref:Uncharacterized protein n=1 Tax=Rhizophagus clarus TaxID=94130 RepID=A0A2Z6S315_9GLOM|nr:hypothetical protein RclHR1_03220011 [Rhizophagus clarus]GES93994.1 hypothetical protein GLOIN_2v1762334 [Rhizophagus clarus]
MNSLELFFQKLYQYEMEKKNNQKTGSKQVVESPILDMNFDFADAPPATANERKVNEKDDKEKVKEKPKKLSIRKVNPPRPIKKRPVEVSKVEPPKVSKRMKRIRNNLRIEMVGYEQRHYAIRSNSNKRGK